MTTSLTYDDWPTLVGRQEPEHLLVDEGGQVEADKAVTLATRVKKRQMPWQENVLRGILAVNPDGLFTHPTAIIIACRQNGKTLSAAELRILYGAYQRRETIVYSAQRWLTAKAVYLRIKQLINSRPSLKKRTSGWLCSQGVAGFTVTHDDGSQNVIMFITRSGDFRGPDEIDLVIYDEAYNLTDNAMAAISPTQLASKNPQTVYLSSAVNQQIHANGEVLARLRRRALAAIGAKQRGLGLYFAEYMAPEPPPGLSDYERAQLREDPETWKTANPSYGVIQSEAKVRKLLTELSPRDFEVEILGWGEWPTEEGATASPISDEIWGAMLVDSPRLVGPRGLALERTRNGKLWTLVACQHTADGRRFIEVGYSASASMAAVVEHVVQVVTALNPIALVIDGKSAAAPIIPELEAAGVEVTKTHAGQLAVASQGILDDALDGRLAHCGQSVMLDAVRGASMRELPAGGFTWDEQYNGDPVAHLKGATLARWALVEFGGNVRPMPAKPRTAAGKPSRSRASDDFDAMSAAF